MGEYVQNDAAKRAYWRANLRPIGGVPLGFWFAQQGAIYVFVALIFIYCFAMNRLDASFAAEVGDR